MVVHHNDYDLEVTTESLMITNFKDHLGENSQLPIFYINKPQPPPPPRITLNTFFYLYF